MNVENIKQKIAQQCIFSAELGANICQHYQRSYGLDIKHLNQTWGDYSTNVIDYDQGCGSGSAKILPLPHRLFDLKSNLEKIFCPFPDVD